MNERIIRVLVVDDDEDDFILVRDTLRDIQECQYSPSWVQTPDEAIARLTRETFDVCLSDYKIGAMSGLNLIKDLREKGCDCPVILVTGMSEREVDLAAAEAGADDYLEKSLISPVRLERVIRYSMAHVERQRLTQAKEVAEEISKLKSAFLATVSHELKTPLHAIVGFTDLMLTQPYGDLGDSRYLEFLRTIQSSTTRLHDVIESILDFSALAAGRFEAHNDVVIPSVEIANSLSALKDETAKKSVELILDIHDPTCCLLGDPTSIRKILYNLISNAVKFSSEGGKIEVACRDESDGGLSLEVRDAGIGMSPSAVSQVYEPFEQTDSALSRNFEGIGLGLTLVRALAFLHGAGVAINSIPDVGTTVTVRFPASRVERDCPSASATDHLPASEKARISA